MQDESIQALIESAKAKLTVAEYNAVWNVARDEGLTEGLAAGFAALAGAVIEMTVEVDPSKCANEWHRTAPRRMREVCPECPPVAVASTVDHKLAANSAYGKSAAHPWPQPCIFENCTVCK
jgi:hypothetical protein